MGNVGYRFLVSFFGLTFTILLIVNLLLFSGLGGFGELQTQGDVYFGYSSFIESINLLETLMDKFSLNGFFNMSSFDKAVRGLLNSMSGGIPRFLDKIASMDQNIFAGKISAFPTFPSVGGGDILNAFRSFVSYFVEVFGWITNILYVAFSYLFESGEFLLAFLQMFLAPLFIIAYGLWIFGFSLYWVFLVFAWVIYLFQGYITKPLPSASYSSWQEVADGWMSEWENFTYVALPLKVVSPLFYRLGV